MHNDNYSVVYQVAKRFLARNATIGELRQAVRACEDAMELRCCVFCSTPTSGTCRVGHEDWSVCGNCNGHAQAAAYRLRLRKVRDHMQEIKGRGVHNAND